MSLWRGRRVLLVCEGCEDIFARRTVDARRSPRHFCSRRCAADALRTGRTGAWVPCSGCGVSCWKEVFALRHNEQLYCSQPCYQRHVDRRALGRRAAASPNRREASPLAKFLRSQKAGFARAKALSPERLSEIGRKAAAARLAAGATRGPGRRNRPLPKSLGWASPLLVRERPIEPLPARLAGALEEV